MEVACQSYQEYKTYLSGQLKLQERLACCKKKPTLGEIIYSGSEEGISKECLGESLLRQSENLAILQLINFMIAKPLFSFHLMEAAFLK